MILCSIIDMWVAAMLEVTLLKASINETQRVSIKSTLASLSIKSQVPKPTTFLSNHVFE